MEQASSVWSIVKPEHTFDYIGISLGHRKSSGLESMRVTCATLFNIIVVNLCLKCGTHVLYRATENHATGSLINLRNLQMMLSGEVSHAFNILNASPKFAFVFLTSERIAIAGHDIVNKVLKLVINWSQVHSDIQMLLRVNGSTQLVALRYIVMGKG